MREVKFDAIYKPTGEHFKPIELNFNENTVTGKFDGSDLDWCHFSFDGKYGDVILRQFTGIRDYKGSEIYEGDVLRIWESDEYIPNRDSGGGIIDYDQIDGFSQIGVVSFHSSWFAYETKKHLRGRQEKIYAPLDCIDNIEVIGNIYQNQELIKQ